MPRQGMCSNNLNYLQNENHVFTTFDERIRNVKIEMFEKL